MPLFRASFLILFLIALPLNAQPVRIIFDTDMGNDIDDALALAMLHAFEARGEVDLLAVTLTKDNPWAAAYVDVVNTFYGRGDLPIGVVRSGKTPEDSPMIRVPADRRDARGGYVYPHRLTDGRDAPDAVSVLRRVLASSADKSVTMVQVGFSTNLARLLDSPADEHSEHSGRELIERKVNLLSVMAGWFPAGDPEYNVRVDIPSARKVFQEWPTPVVASGFEIGLSVLYPATSIERDFSYVEHHPVADAYRQYLPMPYDRPTWDLTSVLYAVRPDDGYFSLSDAGRIVVDDEGRTRFERSDDGPHRYLIMDDHQRLRTREALIYLASQPPRP